jgi:hypothetical protein
MSKESRKTINKDPIQGEGDYEAARRFDKSEEAFVRAGKVEEAARRARPRDSTEAAELARAEELGRKRAKTDKSQEGDKTTQRQKVAPPRKAKP